jgi:tetratricopeptide (TPR) repeat protein
MSRWQGILLLLIGAELVVGAVMLLRHVSQPVPPLPQVELFDPLTADQLRARRDRVRPHIAADWAELAELYLAHGFYPESEACLRRANELAPRDARLRGRWAFCLSRLGQMEPAIERFEQAVALGHPEPAELWYFAGRDYLRLEQTEPARQAFLLAQELPAAQYELAKLEIRDGHPDQAAARLERLQRRYPEAFAPHWLRSRAELQRDDRVAADVFARRAAEAGERLPTPFDRQSERVIAVNRDFGRSRLQEDAKRMIDRDQLGPARRLLEQMQRAQWTSEAADLLADVEFSEGRPEEARKLLDEVLRRDGPTLHGLWRYGDALQEIGQESQAASAWRHAVTLGPAGEAQGLMVKLSQYHEQLGELDEARRWKARFYYAAGATLLRRGEPGPARASLEESLRSDDQNADAWFYLGECQRLLGVPVQAQRAYERCLALRPEHGRAQTELARIASASGDSP